MCGVPPICDVYPYGSWLAGWLPLIKFGHGADLILTAFLPPTPPLTTPLRPLPKIFILSSSVLLRAATTSRVLDRDSGREPGREQPAAPVIPADAEAAPRVHAVEVVVARSLCTAAATAAAADPLVPGGAARRRRRGQDGLLHLAVLLDELPSHDAEDLLDALAALGGDLVAGVPAGLLRPEPAAPLATRAAGFVPARCRRRRRCRCRGGGGSSHARLARAGPGRQAGESRGRRGRRGRGSQAGREVLGYVGDAALEGDFAAGGVARDDVGFRAHDVEDDVGGQVPAQLRQPYPHLGEGLRVGYAVAEDAGVGAAVVESRYRSEPFLSGYRKKELTKRRGKKRRKTLSELEKERGEEERDLNLPVSHICNRTTVSVSLSTTRFVRKLAPTVEVTWAGSKAPLQ